MSNFARCELDSHADTCALGCNYLPLSFTGRVCDKSPYNSSAYQPERDIPIVTAATAYTCQDTGQTYILVINEALWFGDRLAHSLINPNQLRFGGITVNDNPFDPHVPISIKTSDVDIPLRLMGTTIFFESSTPTSDELNSCPHIHLTCDSEWNPHTVRLAAARTVEAEPTIRVGGNNNVSSASSFDSHDVEIGLAQISSIYSFDEMVEAIGNHRIVCATNTFVSQKRHSQVSPEQLSERWNRLVAGEKDSTSDDSKRRAISDTAFEQAV